MPKQKIFKLVNDPELFQGRQINVRFWTNFLILEKTVLVLTQILFWHFGKLETRLFI